MNYDLTEGKIVHKLLRFAFPIMVGNLLQQLYNVVDTLIVGRYLGENALAAVAKIKSMETVSKGAARSMSDNTAPSTASRPKTA